MFALEKVEGADGILRCALVLDAEVIRTEGAARRPFQGWRYLDPAESPRDLPKGRAREEALPASLAQALPKSACVKVNTRGATAAATAVPGSVPCSVPQTVHTRRTAA